MLYGGSAGRFAFAVESHAEITEMEVQIVKSVSPALARKIIHDGGD